MNAVESITAAAAGQDRYGHYVIFYRSGTGYRAAMPDAGTASLCAAARQLLGQLEHMVEVFGPINDSVGGKGALIQARAAIEKARGESRGQEVEAEAPVPMPVRMAGQAHGIHRRKQKLPAMQKVGRSKKD